MNLVASAQTFPVPVRRDMSPQKIQGCGLADGGSRLGRSCCSTLEEPYDQYGVFVQLMHSYSYSVFGKS